MALITLPTSPTFKASRFGLRANTQLFNSPLDGSVQTLERAGARWFGEFEVAPGAAADVAEWRAKLALLSGMADRFIARDSLNTTPRGVATGTPLVDGSAQSGRTFNTKGWAINITGILLEGDYLSFINLDGFNELHIVTADVNSDGTGLAALTVEPPLRAAPTDGTAITVTNPSCEMMLVDDQQAVWDMDDNKWFRIGFSGIEVFT